MRLKLAVIREMFELSQAVHQARWGMAARAEKDRRQGMLCARLNSRLKRLSLDDKVYFLELLEYHRGILSQDPEVKKYWRDIDRQSARIHRKRMKEAA